MCTRCLYENENYSNANCLAVICVNLDISGCIGFVFSVVSLWLSSSDCRWRRVLKIERQLRMQYFRTIFLVGFSLCSQRTKNQHRPRNPKPIVSSEDNKRYSLNPSKRCWIKYILCNYTFCCRCRHWWRHNKWRIFVLAYVFLYFIHTFKPFVFR